MVTATPSPELQELLTLVASWREKSSEAGRKAARARQLPDDYETARERVFESCADELELAWARLADAKARTTPNPELPESVVTDDVLQAASEAYADVFDGMPGSHAVALRAALEAVITDGCATYWKEQWRAANARAEGLEGDARNRPVGQWFVCDGPSGYQHRVLAQGSAFDRTVCDVKETADARLIAAAPAMFDALCKLNEYAEMSNDAQYGTLSASLVKGLTDAAIDAARAVRSEASEGEGS